MMEKERRKREEEDRHIKQLDAIRQENVTRRQEAISKQQAQYRQSNSLKQAMSQQPETTAAAEGISMVKSPQAKQLAKKIEEDYTMFEEVKDDELEDIIEEEIEDESEVEDEAANEDMLLTSQEEREERKERRHELQTLKTQMLTIKEKL
jgi:hypothetical protein